MGSFFDSLPPIFGSQLVKNDPNYVRIHAVRQARREKGVAGSYNHIVTNQGNLVSNETFVGMIENLGDAYEMTEEMFGMIWWLANMTPGDVADTAPEDLVEQARVNYKEGITLAVANKNKGKYQ